MADPQPTATTSDLGVADPIRIPGGARLRRLWSGLPRLGQAFLVLVVVDIVIRALGLFGTSLFIEPSEPLTSITAFVPHDALILLPAVILARRPGALAELPLLARGAVTIALVELLKDPVHGLLRGSAAGDAVLPIVLVSMAGAIATGAGWAAIARDLLTLGPVKPWESFAQLGILVGAALAIVAAGSAAGSFIVGDVGVDDGLTALLVRLTGAVSALSGLGFAYLAWVVARGTDDPSRPGIATRLGMASVTAVAIATFLSLFAGQGDIWILVLIIGYVGGYTGLVVAFGLGLADPSGTIDRAVSTDEPSEQPAPA